MTRQLTLRPEAERDIEDAANWYQLRGYNLGHQFLDEVAATFEAIADRPESFPVVHRGVRRALMHRFPFGVVFLPHADSIIVLAVLHGSRDPRRWQERI